MLVGVVSGRGFVGARNSACGRGGAASSVGLVSDLTADELTFLQGALDLARDGRSDELVQYLDAGLPLNLTSGAGDSLLMLAAYHDHPATVEMLLDRGADTSRVNDRGQTALGAAVFRQSARSVRALLLAGADPGEGRRTALEIAAFFELDEMTDLLRRANSERP